MSIYTLPYISTQRILFIKIVQTIKFSSAYENYT